MFDVSKYQNYHNYQSFHRPSHGDISLQKELTSKNLVMSVRKKRVKIQVSRGLLAKYRLQNLGGSDSFKVDENNFCSSYVLDQNETPIFLIQKPTCYILLPK